MGRYDLVDTEENSSLRGREFESQYQILFGLLSTFFVVKLLCVTFKQTQNKRKRCPPIEIYFCCILKRERERERERERRVQ